MLRYIVMLVFGLMDTAKINKDTPFDLTQPKTTTTTIKRQQKSSERMKFAATIV